jgi:hypothetical protein
MYYAGQLHSRIIAEESFMNTRTRLTPFLILVVLALIVSACKPRLATGPEQTFMVDVPRPETSNAMNVTLEMAVPQGALVLRGGTDGLIQGGITYNAAEYEPQMTNGEGELLIRQSAPGPKTVAVTTQNNLVNQWDLHLSKLLPPPFGPLCSSVWPCGVSSAKSFNQEARHEKC